MYAFLHRFVYFISLILKININWKGLKFIFTDFLIKFSIIKIWELYINFYHLTIKYKSNNEIIKNNNTQMLLEIQSK